MSEIYGYVRVSTQEQNEERQLLIRIYRKKEKWEITSSLE